MPEIVEVVEGVEIVRRVPGESRCVKEAKRLFPGAHFRRVLMIPPGKTEPVTCLELYYCAPSTKGNAPLCAVQIDESDRNSVAIAPIALIRAAFRRYGYDFVLTETVSKGTLDRIWTFTYVPITTPPEAASPEQTKEPTP